MRVLVNATSLAPGGGETFALALFRALSLGNPSDEYVVLVARELPEGVGHWPANLRFRTTGRCSASGVWRPLWEQLIIRRMVGSEHFDLLVGIGGFGLMWSGHPQVIVAQNALFYDQPMRTAIRFRGRRWAQRRLQLASIRAGASVVCVSEYMRDLIERHVGDEAASIAVIPHGTDMHLGEALERGRLDAHNAPVVLWVGVDSPHKGLRDILAAMPTIERRTESPVQLRIAGSICESDREGLIYETRALGIRTDPMFLGHIDRVELRSEYLNCSVLVSTSNVESSDMSVLEAMAMGVPVVATDIPVRGPAKGSMRTYPPGDRAELVAAVTGVLLDEEERERLAIAGLDYAQDRTWRTAATRYAGVFAETIERHRSG